MIGKTLIEKAIIIQVNDGIALKEDMQELRAVWEETSYQLDRLQANPYCVERKERLILTEKALHIN